MLNFAYQPNSHRLIGRCIGNSWYSKEDSILGVKDITAKDYLSRNGIFADAFNYYLYHGEQVIDPDDLEEKPAEEKAVIRKLEKTFAKSGLRDILKTCTVRRVENTTFILLGIEAQTQVHYAMPVRDLLYDALNYHAQVDAFRKEEGGSGKVDITDSFMKERRLHPVITLCICLDTKKWDAPKSLHEMLDVPDPRILANVKQNLTSYGNQNLTLYGKEFFTLFGKENLTSYGNQCKFRLNGTAVPRQRRGHSVLNGAKRRMVDSYSLYRFPHALSVHL